MHEKSLSGVSTYDPSAPPVPGVEVMTAVPVNHRPPIDAEEEEEEEHEPKGDVHVEPPSPPEFETGKFYDFELRTSAKLVNVNDFHLSREKKPNEKTLRGNFVVKCEHKGLVHTSFTVKSENMASYNGIPSSHKLSEIMLCTSGEVFCEVVLRFVEISSEGKPVNPEQWDYVAKNGFTLFPCKNGYGAMEHKDMFYFCLTYKKCEAPKNEEGGCVIV